MAVNVVTKWNFECVNCPKYVKPNKKGYMGFCPIKDKRVAKDDTCMDNPIHTRFWFFMYGVSLEQIILVPDEELRELKAKILEVE